MRDGPGGKMLHSTLRIRAAARVGQAAPRQAHVCSVPRAPGVGALHTQASLTLTQRRHRQDPGASGGSDLSSGQVEV